jgi:hypothetical protein
MLMAGEKIEENRCYFEWENSDIHFSKSKHNTYRIECFDFNNVHQYSD